jgi:hypothetical protein
MNIGPVLVRFVAHSRSMRRHAAKIQAPPGPAIRPWLAAIATMLASAVALVLLSGDRIALASFGYALLAAVPKTLLWFASAAGLGRALGTALRLRGAAAQTAAGVATLLCATQWAGTLGLLQLGIVGALLLLAPGWWMLGRHLLPRSDRDEPAWLAAAFGLAASAMLVASMVPAGFLWSTEFGGYDALSYHLQVPREWALAGRFKPLPHNAYSGLPNFMEGAYAHLMLLRVDPREAALSCQLLHAGVAMLAAWALGDALPARGDGRGVATLAVLATPWVTVTGSLAYSESGVLLGMSLALQCTRLHGAWRSGVLFGLAAATLVGCKASCAVLALPAALAAQSLRPSVLRDPRWWLAWMALLAVALFPWLLRNTIATTAPLFPLLASHLGAGWWSPEQATRWDAAHRADAGVLERVGALWRQFLAFGIGANPQPGEPWRWLWGPLPWLGIAALGLLWRDTATRRPASVLAIMGACTLLGWLAFTHLQSRFLMPIAVPLAAAVGLAWPRVSRPSTRRVAVLAVLSWALLPAWTLVQDSPRSLALVGRVDRASGDLDIELLRSPNDGDVEIVMAGPMVEAALGTLFDGERVLSVGWSTPFWLPPGTMLRWSTVWDTNPVEVALQQPDPLRWLRERFDLMLIDEGMLARWKASGWLAPGLDVARLLEALRGCPQMKLLGGCRLVGLRGELRPLWPSRRPPATDAPY